MKKKLIVGAYVYGVAGLGLAALSVAASALPLDRLPELALFFGICAVVQLMPVPLFRNSAISVSFAVTFASLVYLGPAAAIWVNLGSGIVMVLQAKRFEAKKALFNVGGLALTAGVAGYVYSAIGGPQAPARLDWAILPPAIVAITVYYLVNSGSISGAIALTSGSSLRSVWVVNWRWLAPNYVGLGLVGLGMAVAVAAVGFPGLAVFLAPLGMAWYSFKLYMAKTEEVRRRNEQLQLTNAQLDVANARLQQRVVELDALNKIGLTLNGSLDLGDVLGEIGEATLRLVPSAQAAAVALAETASGRLRVASSVGLPPAAAIALAAYAGPVARAIEDGEIVAVEETSTAVDLAQSGVGALVALPIRINGSGHGAFVVTFAEARVVGDDERRILSTLAEQAATAVHNARLYAEIEQGYLSTVQAMVQVVDGRERYAQGHSERVRAYCAAAAKELGLDARQTGTLELAALFHDIGHIGVPETVLDKPGELTAEEWDLVRKHPLLGVTILKQVPRMEAVVPVILQHHERYDGQGYPAGLLGDDISLLAQILAVADAYEALTSRRPHRPALTRAASVAELRKNAGSQFNPRVVEAFVKATEQAVPAGGTTQAALLTLFNS